MITGLLGGAAYPSLEQMMRQREIQNYVNAFNGMGAFGLSQHMQDKISLLERRKKQYSKVLADLFPD